MEEIRELIVSRLEGMRELENKSGLRRDLPQLKMRIIEKR